MNQLLELEHPHIGERTGNRDSTQSIYCLPGSTQLFSRSCSRCAGLLVNEWTYDLNNSNEISAEVLRCLQCGHRVDPVILRNRVRSQHTSQSISRARLKDNSVNTATMQQVE